MIAAFKASNDARFACWVFELLARNKISFILFYLPGFQALWHCEGTNGKLWTLSEALQLHGWNLFIATGQLWPIKPLQKWSQKKKKFLDCLRSESHSSWLEFGSNEISPLSTPWINTGGHRDCRAGEWWWNLCLEWRKYRCPSPAAPPHACLCFHVYLYFHGFLHHWACVNETEPSLGSFFQGNYWSDGTLVNSGREDILFLPSKLCLFLISSATLCRQTFSNPLNPCVL